MAVPGILSGLRIVEASAFVAAPLAGMTLTQLGADVIRIDARQGGLDHHRWPVAGDDRSLFWCGLNKGKRSVALDLASAEGRDIAMALIGAPGRNAGLFVTNFPPRGWLDYRQLRAQRADLIQVTLQGDRFAARGDPRPAGCVDRGPDAGPGGRCLRGAWRLLEPVSDDRGASVVRPRMFRGQPDVCPGRPGGCRYHPDAGCAVRLLGHRPCGPGTGTAVGQHTEEVLAQLLGIDGPHYARLHDQGIVA